MPIYFQRPENALNRAKEFIEVGKKASALEALYDVIKSRKHRTWQRVHEPIMKLYLELCVDLKKSHIAKEGLFQYRIICQQVNIGSLELVVKEYLALAESKTEEARKASAQAVLESTAAVDDLDQVDTPESLLLLSAVSSEGNQERSDRVLLTPWVKFLWESYRQCLELLRNNSRVERLYHEIAQAAFRFCVNYGRKTEFRKLCDNLRAHLAHIHRFQATATAVNLQSAETQQLQLETRLTQLDMAIRMELWQEAYRAAEDTHAMMCLSRKTIKPQIMDGYYQRLALVFLRAGNTLFHAAALLRQLALVRDLKRNRTQEEMRKLASRALLAALATPLPAARPESDNLVETDPAAPDRNARVLASLLGLAGAPSRATLVRDLARLGVVSLAPPELQQLYKLLETDFEPLGLCAGVQKAFDFINEFSAAAQQAAAADGTTEDGKEVAIADKPTVLGDSDLSVYLPGLKSMMVCRLLREIAQVYESVSIARVLELCPVINAFELEKAVVDAARRHGLQVRIDHRRQALHFGTELSISQREETVDGPYLQAMPSDLIRSQLEKLYRVLRHGVETIEPPSASTDQQRLRQELLRAYTAGARREHRRILERQGKIEKRKEEMENRSLAREEAERLEEEKRQNRIREAEQARLAKEAKERENQRVAREEADRKRRLINEKIEQLRRTEIGARMVGNIEEQELEKMNTEDIQQIQLDHWTRERRELQQRMHKQERKVDHMERAKRLEELPLLEKEFERREEERKALWEQLEAERVQRAVEERALAMEQKKRLARMLDDKEIFVRKLQAERYEEYQKLKEAFDARLAEEKVQRLAARKEERKQERYEAWRREKEEKRRAAEEAERLRIEEEERAERAALEAAREAAAARQRQREREIQEKLDRESEELRKAERERVEKEAAERRAASGPPASGGGGGGSWRSRTAGTNDSQANNNNEGGPPRSENQWTRSGGAGGARGAAVGAGGGGGGADDNSTWRRTGAPPAPVRRDNRGGFGGSRTGEAPTGSWRGK